MANKYNLSKKHILLTILFAVYMSEYMISLIIMDQGAYVFSGMGEMLHYFKMPALAVGFLLFPLSRRLGTGIKTGRILLLISNIVCFIGMISLSGLFFTLNFPVYITSCVISLLSLGFLGGAAYYSFGMGFVNHPYLGRLSGLAGAAAFIIQMTAQYLIPTAVTMLILLLAGFFFTAHVTLASGDRFDWMFDEPLEYAGKGDPSLPGTKMITSGIAAMMLLYLICGLTDTILVSMNFAGDMGMYAWPRFFGAVGYLLGGCLSDLGRRKWLLLSAFCVTILCIPLPLILSEGYIISGTCLYYVIVVAQIVFLNVFFWELAPRTSRPELWTGMSRILSCLAVLTLPLFSSASVMTDIILEVFFAIAVILCIALGGYISQKTTEIEGSISVSDPSEAPDPFQEFAEIHGLTPREKDFFILLIESDDDVQAIASNMNISPRTVYRHINSIYEKTGTASRYALIRYFFQLQGKTN